MHTSASHRTCQCRAENACLGTGARPALRRRSSSLLPSGMCLARSTSLVRGVLALMVRTRVTCAGQSIVSERSAGLWSSAYEHVCWFMHGWRKIPWPKQCTWMRVYSMPL